ncbi:acetyl-coenzyme A transporter 1-like [Penaeus indicus]|uniref:acetyl-coenzyme A transporter 1-like n=1 Tax=Penaeus indicus TaxID=29960 RepID=UPI00300D0A2D
MKRQRKENEDKKDFGLLIGNREEGGRAKAKKSVRGANDDQANILLLLFLYVLQGIPLGLAGSIPMILQNRAVSYKDQATFSLSFWPFSIKLLWAPLVDSVYFQKMGRRKSWLVPAQYLIDWMLAYNIMDMHLSTAKGKMRALQHIAHGCQHTWLSSVWPEPWCQSCLTPLELNGPAVGQLSGLNGSGVIGCEYQMFRLALEAEV